MPAPRSNAALRVQLEILSRRHARQLAKWYRENVIEPVEAVILDARQSGADLSDARDLDKRLVNLVESMPIADYAESIAAARTQTALITLVAMLPKDMIEDDQELGDLEL